MLIKPLAMKMGIMNKTDKRAKFNMMIRKNYMPLETPIVQQTSRREEEMINDLR